MRIRSRSSAGALSLIVCSLLCPEMTAKHQAMRSLVKAGGSHKFLFDGISFLVSFGGMG